MSFDYSNDRVSAKSEKDIHQLLTDIVGEKFREYRQKWNEVINTKEAIDFPLYLVLEQQFKCNLKCPMCVISYPEKVSFKTDETFMSDEIFMKIMEEASKHYCPSIAMNSTEEPLLNKKIFERIKIAKEHGFIDIMMNTNAVLLNEKKSEKIIDSGLTRLLIGFDGFSKKTYEKIRVGAKYEKVMANIERFLEIKKNRKATLPIVRVSFVVNEINKHEVGDFYNYWKNKVDYIAFQDYIEPPVAQPNFTKTNLEAVTENVDCDQPRNSLTIRANGDVQPCCSFWGYYINLDNMQNKTLSEIWQGNKINQIRESFVENKPNGVCKKCLNA